MSQDAAKRAGPAVPISLSHRTIQRGLPHPGPAAAELFRRLARDLTCICDLDGRLRWLSESWHEALGHRPHDLVGRSLRDLVHPEDVTLINTALLAAAAAEPVPSLETRLRTALGEYRWLMWDWAADPSGALYAVARDITDRKHAQVKLAASEARYRLLTEHSTDAITVSNRDGRFDYVSPAGESVFGWTPTEMLGRDVYGFIHPADVGRVRTALLGLLNDPRTVTIAARFRRNDGAYRWLETTGRQIRDRQSGELIAVIGNTRDVAERMTAQDALLVQAQTDALTGTANRAALRERSREALARLARNPGAVALLLLDLDRFKNVNDALGHHVGDEVLIAVADRLEAACRPTDSVARLGGDEFVVLAEGLTSPEDVQILAERFVALVREPFEVSGAGPGDRQALPLTVSIGVAVTTTADRDVEDLLKEADLALYRAKDRGRNRHELYDEELQARTRHRLGTHRLLRRAIADEDLYLRYQPIMRISDGRVIGVEGLLRVRDERGIELTAGDFLAVAEDTGLIRSVDAWVLRQALADQATFRQLDPSVFVSINLSYRSASDGSFADWIATALSAAGLPGSSLRVELTEGALRDASGPSVAGVQRLRNAGVQVGLDDFGTGSSSLSALQRIPLDFLKIDREIVQGALPGTRQAQIVGAVVRMAQALDLEVVAEGVESEQQYAAVRALGCESGQGWHFGQPMPAAEYRHLLTAAGPAADGSGRVEPPVGIEPTTYSLRVNRSTD